MWLNFMRCDGQCLTRFIRGIHANLSGYNRNVYVLAELKLQNSQRKIIDPEIKRERAK